MNDNVLLISSDKIGFEYEELGSILMKSYLGTLVNENNYDYIILVNSAVKLACVENGVIEDFNDVSKKSKILACQTCLNYFELENDLKAGQISNMKEISKIISDAKKVVSI